MSLTDLAQQFPIVDEHIYLNHAAVGPWPQDCVTAIEQFARHNMHHSIANYTPWSVEGELRNRLSRLVNAQSSHDIALLKNTSEGISLVACGFPWPDGANVVIPDCEFPSNRWPWQHQPGIECREVAIMGVDDPEATLLEACDKHTAVLAVSAVQYASGLRLDLERLGRACRKRSIAFFVDAIQATGVVPIDVQACHIDFLCADGHKWMLSPEGVALFYCAARWRERLRLQQWGWRMVDGFLEFDGDDELSATARRFEAGSLNTLGMAGMNASVAVLQKVGIEAVWHRVSGLLDAFLSELSPKACTVVTPANRAGIIALEVENPETVRMALADKGIIAAARGGWLRISPHFYTPAAQMTKAARAINSLST